MFFKEILFLDFLRKSFRKLERLPVLLYFVKFFERSFKKSSTDLFRIIFSGFLRVVLYRFLQRSLHQYLSFRIFFQTLVISVFPYFQHFEIQPFDSLALCVSAFRIWLSATIIEDIKRTHKNKRTRRNKSTKMAKRTWITRSAKRINGTNGTKGSKDPRTEETNRSKTIKSIKNQENQEH